MDDTKDFIFTLWELLHDAQTDLVTIITASAASSISPKQNELLVDMAKTANDRVTRAMELFKDRVNVDLW